MPSRVGGGQREGGELGRGGRQAKSDIRLAFHALPQPEPTTDRYLKGPWQLTRLGLGSSFNYA